MTEYYTPSTIPPHVISILDQQGAGFKAITDEWIAHRIVCMREHSEWKQWYCQCETEAAQFEQLKQNSELLYGLFGYILHELTIARWSKEDTDAPK